MASSMNRSILIVCMTSVMLTLTACGGGRSSVHGGGEPADDGGAPVNEVEVVHPVNTLIKRLNFFEVHPQIG